jgi:limonene-1,2-epoxide hydrolase
MSPKQTIVDFIAAARRLDMETFFGMLDENIHYHTGAKKPIFGRKSVRTDIEALGPITQLDWELVRVAAEGNVVMTERIDRSTINGKLIELPASGVFEVRGGKIVYWRDYFDGHVWHSQGGRPMVQGDTYDTPMVTLEDRERVTRSALKVAETSKSGNR